MEQFELEEYCVAELGVATVAKEMGMEWYHAPLPDGGIPGKEFDKVWPDVGGHLRQHLAAGRRIILHCLGGLGRTGMIAARLLSEVGMSPAKAINLVRGVRPGEIENCEQEQYVLAVKTLITAGQP